MAQNKTTPHTRNTLAQMMAGAPFDLRRTLALAINIAAALGAIHRGKRYYGRLNPANIVIDPATLAVDLAVIEAPPEAAALPDDENLGYISPEQTGRMNRAIDYRTDFYSLGIIVYALLTGAPPFDAKDPLAIIHGHIAKKPVPPHTIKPAVPEQIASIVMKLIEKNTEDRYQSASGLTHDLHNCAQQLDRHGAIEPFALGKTDIPTTLQIPPKIYGRAKETHRLLNIYGEVAEGRSKLCLVSGFAGIGKSALVHEVQKPITAQQGFFVEGKFDQYHLNFPYSAWIQAFDRFSDQLIARSEEVINGWRKAFATALGANGKVITDVIPSMTLIMGRQPEVPELGGAEFQNRFYYVFRRFISVIARPEHPLVIFLDDLQWIDTASIQLITLILQDPDITHLLVIGAYRDNEVDANHRLMRGLGEIKRAGVDLEHIEIKNLTVACMSELLAATLSCDAQEVQPLSRLICTKTGGNPFFTHQMLYALEKENRLRFDFRVQKWQWHLSALRDAEITANVVDLLLQRLDKLPPETQTVLKLAACIGFHFEPHTLGIISERSPQTLKRALAPPLREGIVITSRDGYRFTHDRFHQAIYSLLDQEEKEQTHLNIGRILLDHLTEAQLAQRIFEIVSHFNVSLPLVDRSAERKRVAQLNLRAGIEAKHTNALSVAIDHFSKAQQLVDGDVWQWNDQFAKTLFENRAELLMLTADFDAALKDIDQLLAHVHSTIDKFQAYEILLQIYSLTNQYNEGIAAGLGYLRELGQAIPDPPDEAYLNGLVARGNELMARYSDEDLLTLPPMTDARQQVVVSILMRMVGHVYFGDPKLFPLVPCLSLEIYVAFGQSLVTPATMSMHGYYLCSPPVAEYAMGYRMGSLAVAFLDRQDNNEMTPSVLDCMYGYVSFWKAPIHKSVAPLKEAFRMGLEVGDNEFVAYAYFNVTSILFSAGHPLKDAIQHFESNSTAYRLVGNEVMFYQCLCIYQTMLALAAKSPGRAELKKAIDAQDELYASLVKTGNAEALFVTHVSLAIQDYHSGDYTSASERSRRAMQHIGEIAGLDLYQQLVFYGALSHQAMARNLPRDKHSHGLERGESFVALLSAWHKQTPDVFANKMALVRAEQARLAGQDLEAQKLYQDAITLSKRYALPHEAALALELAADFHRARGLDTIALALAGEARAAYAGWQAAAKVEAIERRYPHLTDRPFSDFKGHSLDLTTVIRASQTIAQEIKLSALLTSLMKIIIENAGAQTGMLVLPTATQWLIEAQFDIDKRDIQVLESIPLEASDRICPRIIHYVSRSQENLVLEDAATASDFSQDDYIRQHRTKSVLCLPLFHKGRLNSILYLENNLIAGAFAPDRVELLEMLCSGAMIALENARIYDQLEQRVAQRTQELYAAQEKAKAALEESKRSEERQKLALFAAQAGTFAHDFDAGKIAYDKRAQEILGFAQPESSFQEWVARVHPHDRDAALGRIQEGIQTGKTHIDNHYRVVQANGTCRHILVQAYVSYTNTHNPLRSYGILFDNSDRHEAEEALKRAKETAEAANRAKSIFLANMSHELRTPLNVILGFSSMLGLDAAATPDQKEKLAVINQSGEHLLSMINDILDLSKIEAGRIELDDSPFDLVALLEEIYATIQSRAAEKGLTFVLNTEAIGTRHLITDAGKLRQIVTNLLGNAVKFTDKGDITVRAATESLPETATRCRIVLEVEDTGPGIDPARQTDIFEPFMQGQGVPDQAGTGLGLSICKKFIDLMGGTIAVESAKGEGALFRVQLLAGIAAPVDIHPPATRPLVIGLAPRQKAWRILIVDDHAANRHLLKSLLEQAGFTVIEAQNGQEALDTFQIETPDFVWMDMRMPVMDGYEAVRQIRQLTEGHQVPIAAITASVFQSQHHEIMAAGCDAIVSKPFKSHKIFETMAHFLGVAYVYADPEDGARPSKTDGLTSAMLAALPLALRQALDETALVANQKDILKVIDRIACEAPQTAEKLRTLVNNFKIERIRELLAE